MQQKFFLSTLSLLLSAALHAQSDFDFTQRWFNESLYNPAAVGNSFSTGYFFHTRSQWVGTTKAPITLAGSFDSFSQSLHSGFGATLAADYIGVYQTYNFRLAYAYYLEVSSSALLSLGLSAGVFARHLSVYPSQLDNANDPILAYNQTKEYAPDFDFGIEYKGAFKWGFTVRHLASHALSDNRHPQSINVWTYLSSRFNVSRSLSLEPMASFTWRDDIYRVEGGLMLYFFKTKNIRTYNDRFWLGAVYRSDHNIALMAGMNVTSKLRLGYSFDYGVGDVATLSAYGTHELFIAFQFDRKLYKDRCCPAY
jgi:type IX secretion system PorP/SprF family membrane protein